jgi:hypothetical protein
MSSGANVRISPEHQSMKQHRYRITVEHLETSHGEVLSRDPLVFTARNHDDLFEIVVRSRAITGLSNDDSAAMAIGLKLLSEIALENRNHPLFSELHEPIREFITKLKKAHAASLAS